MALGVHRSLRSARHAPGELATGSSMKAAVQAVRAHAPARIVVAVPVGAPDTCGQFADIADEIICARTPEPFSAVGQWYSDFSQTTDEEVRELLHESSLSPLRGPGERGFSR